MLSNYIELTPLGAAPPKFQLQHPIARKIVKVTGITDGPIASIKIVEYTSSYNFPVGTDSVSKYVFTGNKETAAFQKYDDGWRVSEVKVGEPTATEWDSCKVTIFKFDFPAYIIEPYKGGCKDGLADAEGNYSTADSRLPNGTVCKVSGIFREGNLNGNSTISCGSGMNKGHYEFQGEMRDNGFEDVIERYWDESGHVFAAGRIHQGKSTEFCQWNHQKEVNCTERDMLLESH